MVALRSIKARISLRVLATILCVKIPIELTSTLLDLESSKVLHIKPRFRNGVKVVTPLFELALLRVYKALTHRYLAIMQTR